jgi:hypothetical protein
MVDISKIVDQALRTKRYRAGVNSCVYDIPSGFKYFCIHPNGRIWGAYCTYYRWEWDDTHRYKNIDCVILINGTPDKGYRYQVGYALSKLDSYKNRRLKDGYIWYKGNDIRDKYPEVCDTIDQILMWMELKR